MIADGTITPFDEHIKNDMRKAIEQRALMGGLIAKFQWNKNHPEDGKALTDEELALTVLCTELVAQTIARQLYKIRHEDRITVKLNGPGKADM